MFFKPINPIVPFTLMACLCVVTTCTESIHTKQMPDTTREILSQSLLLSEILEITKGTIDHTTVENIFSERANRYKHAGSEQQGEMNVEGYLSLDSKSPIIGYSLFFYNESGSLVMIDATVNPHNQDAIENTEKLIEMSFDSVEAVGNSKLYFLGIYGLNQKRALKVMVRKADASFGSDYAIRYGISSK